MSRQWAAFGVLCFGLVIGAVALAADDKIDLSGTWILKKTDAKFFPGVSSGDFDGAGKGGGSRGGGGAGDGEMAEGGRRDGGGFPGGRRGRLPVARETMDAKDLKLVITESANGLNVLRKWTRNGQEQGVTQSFTVDGNENSNPAALGQGQIRTKARWQKKSLLIEGTLRMPTARGDADLKLREEYSLSRDGGTLTVKTNRISPMGEVAIKQVFQKE